MFYGTFGLAVWGAPRVGKSISAAYGFQGVTIASAGLLLFSTVICFFAMPGGNVARLALDKQKTTGSDERDNLWSVMWKIGQDPDMILLLLMRGFHASGAHLALATMGLFIKDGYVENNTYMNWLLLMHCFNCKQASPPCRLKIDPSLLSELFSWLGLIFMVCMMIQVRALGN